MTKKRLSSPKIVLDSGVMTKRREEKFQIRVDGHLADAANDKALAWGLSPVVRVLLRRWLLGETKITDADIAQENRRTQEKKARPEEYQVIYATL